MYAFYFQMFLTEAIKLCDKKLGVHNYNDFGTSVSLFK